MTDRLVLGTRGSDLALAQTRLVEEALKAQWPELQVETKRVATAGDRAQSITTASDSVAGRKGLFTAELERVLANGEIDFAVHSAKDLPSQLTAGTKIVAVLPRAPVEDVMVSLGNHILDDLEPGGVIATGSIRRQCQLRWKRPDLDIISVRGNVPTRLRKLVDNEWGGIILARAGLERLGFAVVEHCPILFEGVSMFPSVLPLQTFLPAGGQGVIAVQARDDDRRASELARPINDIDTWSCLRAEREFLRLLHADCNQPIGVLATRSKDSLQVRAQIFDENNSHLREAAVEGVVGKPEELAAHLIEKICNSHG